MHPRSLLRRLGTIRDVHRRYGFVATLKFVVFRLVNAFIFFDCFYIIMLERACLKPLDVAQTQKFHSQLATLEDVERMRDDPRWDIGDTKIGYFKSGDSCVVSCIDGQPAGYSWAHSDGRPELIPGLVLSVPRDCLYNFASLTLPEFRGSGLQSYRHHSLLIQARWHDRRALLGYVRATNFASQRGQAKSGYKRVGAVWLIGGRRRFIALFSRTLRQMGIRRLRNSSFDRESTV